jgi:hypothetical protein
VRLFLGKLAACDGVIPVYYLFRESRIFQSPECKDTWLEFIGAIDIILTVRNSD